MSTIAHDLIAKPRTKDVLIEEQLNFSTLLLSDATLFGLEKAGFKIPSPIQLKAIPIGKCGFDLMIESKSGTGKTVVFTVIALELIKLSTAAPQVLILAPTREVAVQICDVLRTVGAGYTDLKVESFIGGFPVEEDTKKLPGCQIVVGAPGRIKHLIKMGVLSLKSVKLFVLDEVDKLLEESFQPDVNDIFKNLPRVKQIITLSATYTDKLKVNLEKLMYSPTFIAPNTGSPLLLGLRQFVSIVKCNLNVIHQMNIKNEELLRLLQKISFSQCIIFSNYQTRAENISNTLNRKGWNSTYISGAQTQVQRLEAINSLKNLKCRILLSTDVTARGIDASNVDLIINYDVPNDASTYLHRMGRAGRYGSYGACITLAADGKDLHNFQVLLGNIGGTVMSVPKLPNDDIPADLLNCDLSIFEAVFGIVDVGKNSKDNFTLDISKSVMGMKNSKYDPKTKQHESLMKETDGSSFINLDNFNTFLDMRNENEKKMESQVANLEPHDLLQSLASGKQISIQDSSSVTDVIGECVLTESSDNQLNDACDSKKRKRNYRKRDHVENSSENNLKSRKDSETDSHDIILLKNIALLNVTKLLVNDFKISDIEHEIVESINIHLNILRDNNQSIINYYVNTLQSKTGEILFQLGQGVIYTSDAPLLKNENQIIEQKENKQELEHIFQLGFDYAVNPKASYWLDVLGEDFQEKVNLSEDEPDYIQVQKEFSYSDEERSHKRRNKHKHHHKKKKHNAYHKESRSNSEHDLDGDKKFVQWYNKTHKEDVNELNYNYDSFAPEYEYYNNEHFTKCFEYYNRELAEQAETFENTASFAEWFLHWQYQVQGVRDYVQQNIYLQEMNRYAFNKN